MAKRTKKAAGSAALDPALLRRVIVEGVSPQVDEGRYPAKATTGEEIVVEADVFADGHDILAAVVLWRPRGTATWRELPMTPLGNDRWRGSFPAALAFATYEFTVEGWVDAYATWKHGLEKKIAAGQDVSSERLEEKLLPKDRGRSAGTRYGRVLSVIVERERARFGAWYEMFPRSATADPARSGTFKDAEARLTDIAAMGFDVVYLPPVHPIGDTHRKGRNNALRAGPDDPGSPWAIGSRDGGHTAIERGLGTLADFDHFVARARGSAIDVAMALAIRCSPDEPWVTEHPEWFEHCADGSIRWAANPRPGYR